MLAIADCNTSRLSQAADVVRALYRHEKIALWFVDDDAMPMSSDITNKSVEATAYLFWGALQRGPTGYPDEIGRLETSLKLAPKCGAAYFALASARSLAFEPNAPFVSEGVAKLFRKAWELGDSFLRKQHFPIPVPNQK